MFSRGGVRVIAAVVAMSMLVGCAEFDRRGGVVAEIEDIVLFTAHTKSHRLFRSYMLIGVLTAAARQGGHNEADKAGIEGSLKAALAVAFEAYECLYQDSPRSAAPDWIAMATALGSVSGVGTVAAIEYALPNVCQFFDEKMARLDYALYRLALSSLFNEKTSAQLSTIRDKLVGEIPVLSASAKAAIFAAKAANQATNVVDDLLNLSFSSLGPTLTLLPLYRDSLEMNMWVIVDTLTRACWDPNPLPVAIALSEDGTPKPYYGLDCQTKAYASYILNNGNGDLTTWRGFVRQMNYMGAGIEAYQPHFALVTRLIWRSCRNLLTPDECGALVTNALNAANYESLQVKVYLNKDKSSTRTYSASRNSPSRFARQRFQVPENGTPSRSTNAPAARDSEPTGSIGQPKTPTEPTAPPVR